GPLLCPLGRPESLRHRWLLLGDVWLAKPHAHADGHHRARLDPHRRCHPLGVALILPPCHVTLRARSSHITHIRSSPATCAATPRSRAAQRRSQPRRAATLAATWHRHIAPTRSIPRCEDGV